MPIQRIALLGSGAVARALGPRLRGAGLDVVCWARDPARAADVAPAVGFDALGGCDLAWILVSDRAIAQVAGRLADAGAPPIVLHASGFHGTEVLAALRSIACGALHPLVSFPRGAAADLEGGSYALSGGPAATAAGRELVQALGGRVLDLPDTRAARRAYHAAAALSANGLVALIDLALETLGPHVDRAEAARGLAHLARGVLDHVGQQDTAAALTGPVARGDAEVVAGHLEALPEPAAAVYRQLLGRMLILADLDPDKAAAIRALLDE